MQPIVEWLEGLGFGQYGEAFVQADIDIAVLPDLTDAELAQLGVTLGHRKKLLRAIAALSEGQANRPGSPSPSPEPTATSGAERRQVTVMFCDLVGSTELASHLDPEDLREVIGRYHACVAKTVRRFGGFVAKYMGDGVLIYFGYPHAHEDDPEQAVRAGLALVDSVGELNASEPLQVRIGIATGLVVVGDLIGEGESRERGIVGETPNLAARLQAIASPGAVVIAGSTRRQIGSFFELRDLGPRSLKGYAEEQPAWRVLSENRAIGRFEALRSRAAPLVGRDEELELLLRRWAQAKSGTGRVVLISAEPGFGKSRLAEALARRIAGEPHVRLRYFCSPHHQDSALYPFIAQLEHAADFSTDDSDQSKLIKLGSLLDQSHATDDAVALIGELLSVRMNQREQLQQLSPEVQRERTLSALLAQFAGLAAKQPVLMIFEDVHWIDPSSRELLDRIIERLECLPVLLLATFRPEFQPPWTGQPNVTNIALTRLNRCNAAAMINHIAGNCELPADIVQEIAERTDGVPLFIEEVTKAAIELGVKAGETLSSIPQATLTVPATLHASLVARLDKLGPAAREVAQKGAAIGREFSYKIIAAIVDGPEPDLRQTLERLTSAGLLFARGAPPSSTYLFKHALVLDVAYSTLVRAARRQVHGRVAALLEQKSPDIVHSQPALLAHHFTEAGIPEKAVAYWLKAGQQALARSATREAAALLTHGLGLVSKIAVEVVRNNYELDLQIALGQALIAAKGYTAPAVGQAYARARELCYQLERPGKLLPVLYGQWAHHSVADLKQSERLAEEISRLGEMQDHPIARVMGCRASGLTHLFLGDFAAARAQLERGIALYDPGQHASYAAIYATTDPLTFFWSYSSLALVCCGYLDQTRSRSDAALRHARSLSHAHSLAFALNWACLVGWCARLAPTVLLSYADEFLKLSDEHEFLMWRAIALVFRGWCLTALGQPDQGIPSIATGLSEVRTNVTLHAPHVLTLCGDAHRMAGQPQAALAYIAEATQFAEETQARWLKAETLRLQGDLLLLTGDATAAEVSYRYAIALAKRQSARSWELRTSASLARFWRDQGKIVDAHDLLTPIYSWFTEGFDTPDLIEAKALLNELGAALGRSPVAGCRRLREPDQDCLTAEKRLP